jgi:hypothetical protein
MPNLQTPEPHGEHDKPASLRNRRTGDGLPNPGVGSGEPLVLPLLEEQRGRQEPVLGPYVGCPWQLRNPDLQDWYCEWRIAQHITKPVCVKASCEQYTVHAERLKVIAALRERIRDFERLAMKREPSPGTQSEPVTSKASATAGGEGDGSIEGGTDPASLPS